MGYQKTKQKRPAKVGEIKQKASLPTAIWQKFLGLKPKFRVLVILWLVVLLLVVWWAIVLWPRSGYESESFSAVCSDSEVTRAVTAIAGNKPEDLKKLAEAITTKSGYEYDVNCAIPVIYNISYASQYDASKMDEVLAKVDNETQYLRINTRYAEVGIKDSESIRKFIETSKLRAEEFKSRTYKVKAPGQ